MDVLSSHVCFTWEIPQARHLLALRDAKLHDETRHFLARHLPSGRNTHRKQVSKVSVVHVRVQVHVCMWTGYTHRSVPPRQLSLWEQYHLSLMATRQWRPDGEQRVEDGTKCWPTQEHQIKFFSYSWCQEPMVLLFSSVCPSNTVHGHLSCSLLISFCL